MKVFNKLKTIPSNLPHGTAKRGFQGFLVDKGERYAFAGAFGFAKGYYGPKFLLKGHGIDLWVGAGATLAASLLTVFGGSRTSGLAPHIERLGDAGMMSALGSLAAAFGAKKAGRVVTLTGGDGRQLTAVRGDVLGAIPGAVGGAWLTADDIARRAHAR